MAEDWVTKKEINKVLVLFPLADGQTGPAIVQGLKNLGIKNKAIDPHLNFEESSIQEFEPNLIICGRERSLVDRIEEIREATDAKVVVWNPDVRYDIRYFEDLFPLFRRASAYYSVGMGNLPLYRGEGVNAYWLPQGVQDELYHPVELTEADHAKYDCDICFIGRDKRRGLHEGRSKVLDLLEDFCDQGYEYKWWGCRGGEELWGEEHNKAVQCAKINIGHSGWPSMHQYMSVRNWKILGAGGFLLANYHKNMEKWLPIEGDKALDYYVDEDMLISKVKYYLKHAEEREEIAARGLEFAAQNTYTKRVKRIVDHASSPQFYFHHYKDLKDCNIPVLDPRNIPADPPKKVVATVATEGCLAGVKSLIQSLKKAGWYNEIRVYTTGESLTFLTKELASPNVSVRLGSEWYRQFVGDQKVSNADARYIKPTMVDMFEEGDKVLVLDGADTLVFGDVNQIFDKLDDIDLLVTPGEKDKESLLPAGYEEAFFKGQPERFNSGVFAFKTTDKVRNFFALWKAFCAWSLKIGYGDMCAYLMALDNFYNDFEELDVEWNYLFDYGVEIKDRLLTKEGNEVKIFHAAGKLAKKEERCLEVYKLLEK